MDPFCLDTARGESDIIFKHILLIEWIHAVLQHVSQHRAKGEFLRDFLYIAYIQYFTMNSVAALLGDIDIASMCSCLHEMVSFQTKIDYIRFRCAYMRQTESWMEGNHCMIRPSVLVQWDQIWLIFLYVWESCMHSGSAFTLSCLMNLKCSHQKWPILRHGGNAPEMILRHTEVQLQKTHSLMVWAHCHHWFLFICLCGVGAYPSGLISSTIFSMFSIIVWRWNFI